MRVLLLTQVLPFPPDSGPKIKTWNLLKFLASHHEVTLVSFVRGDQRADVERLRPFCKTIHTLPIRRDALSDVQALLRSLVTRQPWMMLRDDRTAMRKLINQIASETQFDIAHADQLNMAQYAQRLSNSHKVIDAHNALWLLYKRLAATMKAGPKKWLLERDWRLLKQYEGNICREFDAVLAVSDEDKLALQEACECPKEIIVIPIAIDTQELKPIDRQSNANHILHVGTMYWPPNIDGIEWFVDKVYPLIYAQKPEVVFDLVGARPPQSLLELNKQDRGINVTGYVKDLSPYMQHAGVFIVPLRAGGGMRVKILEALAQSLPVVTTSIGCEGILVESSKHLLIADSPEQFSQAVLKILCDRTFADELGFHGRKLIEEQYDYQIACKAIDKAYQIHKQLA